jgi:hypothetical protein
MSARGVPVTAGRHEDNRGMARRVAPSPPGLPRPLVGGLLGVRFVSELALLAGAAWAAGTRVHSTALAALAGVLAALAVAAVWGVWVAPASHRRLADPLRLAVEVVLFTVVAAALLGVHRVLPAVLLAVVGLGTAVAVRALPSSEGA